jgi:hypothetical protein
MKLLIMQFSPAFSCCLPLRPKHFFSSSYSQAPKSMPSLIVRGEVSHIQNGRKIIVLCTLRFYVANGKTCVSGRNGDIP